MKKNKAMRLASCLLVLTLLTACMISGAFAKYVSTDTSTDTARVAKWGVTAQISGTLFGKTYNGLTGTGDNEIGVTSKSVSSTDNVVAPGTQNTTGMTLSITGTPEVASKITAASTTGSTPSDIWLKAGKYGVLAKAEGVTANNVTDYYVKTSGTYEKASSYTNSETYYKLINKAYYQIKWALTKKGEPTDNYNIANIADLYTAIETAFKNGSSDTSKAPGTTLDTTYTIKWKWDFDDTAASGKNDGADTILSTILTQDTDKVVVKTTDDTNYTAIVADDYSTNLSIDMTLAVTQVD